MIIYWFFFTVSAFFLITDNKNKKSDYFFKPFFYFLLLIFIGFRHEIGGDWDNYIEVYESITLRDVIAQNFKSDFAYNILLFICKNLNLGIYGVNTICGAIVLFSVHLICSLNKNYWICFLILLPYLILVVSTGYTRQSVSIALSIIGIYYLIKDDKYFQNYLYCAFYILLALLFHKSAIIMLIFIIPFLNLYVIALGFIFSLLSLGFLLEYFQAEVRRIMDQYIYINMISRGAILRSAVILPSLVFHFLASQYKIYTRNERKIFNIFSILVILFLILIFINPLTILDRFALYLLPISAILYSKFAYVLVDELNIIIYKIVIILFVLFQMFVWFHFSVHKSYWVPYKSLIFNYLNL